MVYSNHQDTCSDSPNRMMPMAGSGLKTAGDHLICLKKTEFKDLILPKTNTNCLIHPSLTCSNLQRERGKTFGMIIVSNYFFT